MTNNNNTLMIILIVVLVLFLVGGFGGGMMVGFYNFGWLINLIVLCALVFFILWIFKQVKRTNRK